jgi:hypothetical protein
LISTAHQETHQLVARCPACGAYEAAEAEAASKPHDMVCRECGETWSLRGFVPDDKILSIDPPDTPEAVDVPSRPGRKSERKGEVLVAEKRALVTYSDTREDAWAAKMAGDYWPEPPQQSRIPMIAGAIAAVLFLVAFFGAREAAVAALPDLASLYRAIGMPVNLDGFAIEAVGAERTPTFGASKLTVRATIHNLGKHTAELPPLAVLLYSTALVPAGALGFDPPAGEVPSGGSVQIVLNVEAAPKEAAEVVVRFRQRGETFATAGTAELDPR